MEDLAHANGLLGGVSLRSVGVGMAEEAVVDLTQRVRELEEKLRAAEAKRVDDAKQSSQTMHQLRDVLQMEEVANHLPRASCYCCCVCARSLAFLRRAARTES